MDPKVGDVVDADVLISDDHIVEIGRSLTPRNATIIDGRGRIVIPGLVNAEPIAVATL